MPTPVQEEERGQAKPQKQGGSQDAETLYAQQITQVAKERNDQQRQDAAPQARGQKSRDSPTDDHKPSPKPRRSEPSQHALFECGVLTEQRPKQKGQSQQIEHERKPNVQPGRQRKAHV